MRIGYVGASSPIFYDYKNPATKTHADESSSPNPVLDGPFGLILLFDELWFLCRSLCPENLREAPFVRFMDEGGMLPAVPVYTRQWERDLSNPEVRKRSAEFESQWLEYWDIVREVGVDWDAAPDNHTHGLNIAGQSLVGNSRDPGLIDFDLELLNRLGRSDVELVTNTFTHHWMEGPSNPLIQIKMADLMIIDNIPSYQTAQGPYHPCLEEARENSYLKAFRKWVVEKSKTTSVTEIKEVKAEVENSIQKIQEELFLRHLSGKSHVLSAGKSIGGALVDLVFPGASTLASLAESVTGYFKDGDARWQGFLVSTRRLGKG